MTTKRMYWTCNCGKYTFFDHSTSACRYCDRKPSLATAEWIAAVVSTHNVAANSNGASTHKVVFACPLCDTKTFSSRKKLSLHNKHVHGIIGPRVMLPGEPPVPLGDQFASVSAVAPTNPDVLMATPGTVQGQANRELSLRDCIARLQGATDPEMVQLLQAKSAQLESLFKQNMVSPLDPASALNRLARQKQRKQRQLDKVLAEAEQAAVAAQSAVHQHKLLTNSVGALRADLRAIREREKACASQLAASPSVSPERMASPTSADPFAILVDAYATWKTHTHNHGVPLAVGVGIDDMQRAVQQVEGALGQMKAFTMADAPQAPPSPPIGVVLDPYLGVDVGDEQEDDLMCADLEQGVPGPPGATTNTVMHSIDTPRNNLPAGPRESRSVSQSRRSRISPRTPAPKPSLKLRRAYISPSPRAHVVMSNDADEDISDEDLSSDDREVDDPESVAQSLAVANAAKGQQRLDFVAPQPVQAPPSWPLPPPPQIHSSDKENDGPQNVVSPVIMQSEVEPAPI